MTELQKALVRRGIRLSESDLAKFQEIVLTAQNNPDADVPALVIETLGYSPTWDADRMRVPVIGAVLAALAGKP